MTWGLRGGDDVSGGLDELGDEFWESAYYCGSLRYSYEPGKVRRRACECPCVYTRVSVLAALA